MKQIFTYKEPFVLESGQTLPEYHLAYHTFGQLNSTKDNVVWVFHALTANSDPIEWWPGLIGDGRFFDPAQYFIVCANIPGSCYGSLSPFDINPASKEPYYHDFPLFTTRDIIRAFQPLRKHLGIEKIHVGIGGSLGGQQLLEWAVEEPELFKNIVPLATNAVHSAWGIAFNASQRMCIEQDPTWHEKSPTAGSNGMKIARSIALISYRNYITYEATQKGVTDVSINNPIDKQVYKAETYQHYQGEKLVNRFNAFSYYLLSRTTDSHNVGRGRNSCESALASIKARTLVIGISSDLLFPPSEQGYLARHIPNTQLAVINSLYGHDGFLLEFQQIETLLKSFINEN